LERLLDKPVIDLNHWDWEKALYVLIIVMALVTRLYGLGDRVQSHDESIHTRYSWNLYTGRGFVHDPLMHGPFLFHATALSYFLFGDNDYAARVPVALLGVILVAIPYLLRRWLGRVGALMTSFFLLISPAIAYYSRYIRHDIPAALWATFVVWAVFAYLADGRSRWLHVMAAGVSLMFATKEVAFIYSAIIGLFLVVVFVAQILLERWNSSRAKDGFSIGLGLLCVGLLALAAVPRPEDGPLPWYGYAGAGVAGVGAAVVIVALLLGVGERLRQYRLFDLIVVLGTLCLPFLSPLLINAVKLDPLDYQPPTIYYSGLITAAVFAISVVIGLLWNMQRWPIVAGIFYAIYLVFFTTFFTNGYGIASGLVGSLGYWLKQQAVERGSQPVYYYTIMVSFYEFMPLILAALTPVYLVAKALLRRKAKVEGEEDSGPDASSGQVAMGNRPVLVSRLFLVFLLWWTVAAWAAYSYAGERMPWLTVHVTLPMILLSGWLVGRVIEDVDWQRVIKRRAWILALVFPPFIMAIVALGRSVAAGPFQGYELEQLNVTGRFLGALAGCVLFGGAVISVVERGGWRQSLAVVGGVLLTVLVGFTIRTAWRFCYVTYDYATEFLVYAHAAPAVNRVMDQIEEISQRTLDSPNALKVAYGADGSTLWYWQLRNFPNATFYGEKPTRGQMDAPVIIAGRPEWDEVQPYLGDDYVMSTYAYLWWPMEDYRQLTWSKLLKIVTDPQVRAAMWDIWYNRDYTRYDALMGTNHTVDDWPLRSDFRFYVRKDVLAQAWDLSTAGVLDLAPLEGEEEVAVDPYEAGWRDLAPRLVIGSEGSMDGQLLNPRGVAVGEDGAIYVADSGNHRVEVFGPDGTFVRAWGGLSNVETESGAPAGFNEPWGLAVASDGSVYVADTWNHRIQWFGPEGRFLGAWGKFGQSGPSDVGGEFRLFGPRDIAVGADGLLYVTDTGNKRVLVYEPDGSFVRQWGGGGVLEGYLDEPVGIAAGPEGWLYVADTWNKRVQVFDEKGNYVIHWPIEGWDSVDVEDKPYIAVDSRGYVYVTDPSGYRVLVFDSMGGYVMSFGQYGFDEGAFAYPTGIAIGPDDSIYVTDARSGRVLVYDALTVE